MVKERCRSLARITEDFGRVGSALDSKETSNRLRNVTKPPSLAGTMRKVGIALIVMPDPPTTVAGAALVAGSFVMKGREPASLADLMAEAAKGFGELGSLQFDLSTLSI